MLTIDPLGMVQGSRIKAARQLAIERAPLTKVVGIIVHETDSPTAAATLNGYKVPGANGAHFLIDRDGTILQTASIFKQTQHAGKLKARCVAELRCTPTEIEALGNYSPSGENRREMQKEVPERYPANTDSLGIEMVGLALPKGLGAKDDDVKYQAVTEEQNASLRWLVQMLTATLGVSMHEIFRHPTVSRKNKTEAGSARW